MRIAFYAPLKPPDHPTPSGDRLMANLLMKALATAGHEVMLASRFRAFSHEPALSHYWLLKSEALQEADRLMTLWTSGAQSQPDLWFTYHPYYRAPDWIGPAVTQELGIPLVTAEASYAAKRDTGPWQPWQADAVAAVRLAACNFYFTERDRQGLVSIGGPIGRLVALPPFLGMPPEWTAPPLACRDGESRLVSVAMMRPGDKLKSFQMLGQALGMLIDIPWRLVVIGGGPAREDVASALSPIPEERIAWRGELPHEQVAEELVGCDLYVWPGTGEAYGLAYLEAQAMGLPVVAQATGGIESVVHHGKTGWLTPFNDVKAFAEAIRNLLLNAALRRRMGAEARQFVRAERGIANAARTLNAALNAIGNGSGTSV